ncbi:unnamed protein product [Anisakis simplex]|uniref:Cyclic nucleotide-binding domain-containing protein n=1 Tax=Anisakis simplex TaxID=6269 RepID=A0A0M3JY09_ANISI|nr:unnamed protein product [Anisakis simplex]
MFRKLVLFIGKRGDDDIERNSDNYIDDSFLNTREGATDGMNITDSANSRSRSNFWVDDTGSLFYWWTMIVSLACLYNLIMIVIMVFEAMHELHYIEWFIGNGITDFVDIIDIFIQSRRSFLENGVRITNRTATLRNYRKRLIFLADFIAILPTDLILLIRNDLTIVRVNRLLKVHRIFEFVDLTQIRTTFPSVFRVFKLAITCFILFHWNGCLYFLLSIYYDYHSAQIEDWIFSYDKIVDPILTTCASYQQDSNCSFNETNRNAINRDEYLNDLIHYWQNREVPSQLQTRIIDWFAYTWAEGQAKVDEKAIAKFIPGKLYRQMAVFIHMENLRRIKLFEDCDPGLLHELILMLQLRVYNPGDYVCKKGDIGKGLQNPDHFLSPGSDFDPESFFYLAAIPGLGSNKNGNRRTAAIRSVGFSDLYVLSKEGLWEALEEYPEAKLSLFEKGRKLLEKDNLLVDMDEDDQFDSHANLEDRLLMMIKGVQTIDDQLSAFYEDFIVSIV